MVLTVQVAETLALAAASVVRKVLIATMSLALWPVGRVVVESLSGRNEKGITHHENMLFNTCDNQDY